MMIPITATRLRHPNNIRTLPMQLLNRHFCPYNLLFGVYPVKIVLDWLWGAGISAKYMDCGEL
jgi:hypothetical protein